VRPHQPARVRDDLVVEAHPGGDRGPLLGLGRARVPSVGVGLFEDEAEVEGLAAVFLVFDFWNPWRWYLPL